MRIIDCFMYFDEDLMLDIRLNILSKFVDKFVICEATLDHAGNSKKLNFDINKFKKFEKQIEYIVIEDLPKTVNKFKKNWHSAHFRDQFQRNTLLRGIKECNDNDLIMISDLDEIPNPKKIKDFNENCKYACFIQRNFSLKLNLLNKSEPNWFGTRLCRKKDLKSPQWLRNIKARKRPFYKFFKPKFDKFMDNGGWHFSSVKNAEDIFKKLNSYAEQQWNNEKFKNLETIKRKIRLKEDLFDRNHKFEVVSIDSSFPDYIYKNKDKFEDFIYSN